MLKHLLSKQLSFKPVKVVPYFRNRSGVSEQYINNKWAETQLK